jgi:hypothetical protein
MLKSITREQAEEIYEQVYREISLKQGADGNENPGAVPIQELRVKVDPLLAPYGWSFDTLFNFNAMDIS